MASGSVWGIDIGKSSLKAVRMRTGKTQLDVQALFYEEYPAGDDGTIPPSEASRALEALIAKHPEVKKERVLVALPGHSSFSRFIRLPAFDPRKLVEMVGFEARQQVPNIDEVNWDFSLIDRDYEEGEERDVGIFAIKRDVIYALIADLSLSGLEPYAITTAPLAIYNFIRWDTEASDDEVTVVLDVGFEHTDLVLLDGQRYWFRTLKLNGFELTKAISTRLKVPVAEAEKLKRDAQQSKDSRKIYQATELVLKDFVAEIQRSIAHYKALNKDRQVQVGKILLLGNASKLANVRPYFQKELGIPVETVKPPLSPRLELDFDEDDEYELLKEHLATFAVALGLGIQGCGEGFNEVNLLPEEIRQRQALEQKKLPVAVAMAVVWFTVIASYLFAGRTLDGIKGVSAEASKQVMNLKLVENEGKIKDAKGPVEALRKDVRSLVAYTAKRNLPLEVLNKLADVLPKANAQVVELTAAQQRDLEHGKDDVKVNPVKKAVGEAQDKLDSSKVWIVEMNLKENDDGSVHVSLLCARKYARNAQGIEDELQTQTALETGLLADIRRAFPKAKFADTAHAIWNLDKDATIAPAQGGFGSHPQKSQKYMGITIGIDWNGEVSG